MAQAVHWGSNNAMHCTAAGFAAQRLRACRPRAQWALHCRCHTPAGLCVLLLWGKPSARDTYCPCYPCRTTFTYLPRQVEDFVDVWSDAAEATADEDENVVYA